MESEVRLWARRLLLPGALAALAVLCALGFAATHELGLRPCVGFLSGTPVRGCTFLGVPLGLPYAGAWFLASLAAPPLLIASGLLAAWELIPARLKQAAWEAAGALGRPIWSMPGWALLLTAGASMSVLVLAGGVWMLASIGDEGDRDKKSFSPDVPHSAWCMEKAEALIRAVEEHCAVLGRRPKSLDELVPRFIPALPPEGYLPGDCGRVEYADVLTEEASSFTLSIRRFPYSFVYHSKPSYCVPPPAPGRIKRSWSTHQFVRD